MRKTCEAYGLLGKILLISIWRKRGRREQLLPLVLRFGRKMGYDRPKKRQGNDKMKEQTSQIHIVIPEDVSAILKTLSGAGFEAYAVGGCVRDSLLGRRPQDWDITTSAMPEQVKSLFDRTFDTGIEHGTVTVLQNGVGYEVTTYRIDGTYADGRHPDSVIFTRNLREDLLRRDFTINAMACNEEEGLVDLFGGLEDLEQGVIRCVGNARERFSEDALRILRGVRFAAQLGFELEEETREGMRLLAPALRKISAERVQAELIKILESDRPDMLRTAWELGITAQFLPEFDRMMETEQETPHHMYSVGEHTLHALLNVRKDKVLRLTMLFHDMGKPDLKTVDQNGTAHFKKHAGRSEELTKQILRRLKFDNDTLKKVTVLVRYHDYRMPAEAACVRRAIYRIGKELFPLYLEVRRADVAAQSRYQREEKMADIEAVEQLYRGIMERGDCVSLKELAVNGKDLIREGFAPGKSLGSLLDRLLDAVLEDPALNQKETLLELAGKLSS